MNSTTLGNRASDGDGRGHYIEKLRGLESLHVVGIDRMKQQRGRFYECCKVGPGLDPQLTWDWHGARSLLLQNLMQHQLQDVGEVGQVGAASGYLEGVAT